MTSDVRELREQVLSTYAVSRETAERLDVIVGCLDQWRQRINLVGPKEWPVIWSRHIADSLQLVDQVDGRAKIIDLGSGAGFPGLVIAAAAPGVERVSLVESVGKKCAFLRAASVSAGLPVDVINARIESLEWFPVDVVTARALAPLPKLLEYCEKWLTAGALGVFPKGETAAEELTAARQKWTFVAEQIPSRTSPAGQILKLSEVKRRD